jgi:hypothetical protein
VPKCWRVCQNTHRRQQASFFSAKSLPGGIRRRTTVLECLELAAIAGLEHINIGTKGMAMGGLGKDEFRIQVGPNPAK